MTTKKRKVLEHPDLEIERMVDIKGKEFYSGKSHKYEPYTATAETVYECFFRFDIQLAEQKVIAGLIT